ncbi:MAG TPA: hypothetical protein VK816_06045 [Jatrophihabitantaceae bacterium]|nr:hypothetical protein [Jatrophihabitantaceae bacterium]
MTDTVARPAPPRNIKLASATLGAAALLGVAAALAEPNAAYRNWAYKTLSASDLKASKAAKNPVPMPSSAAIHSSVDKIISSSLIISLLGGVLMLALAVAIWKGRYWARWSTVGIWVLGTIFGSLTGLGSLLGVSGDSPAPYRLTSFVGAVAFIASIVLINLRPSVEYLALTRPPRPVRGAAGGGRAGGGGLFAQRAPRTAAADRRGAAPRGAAGPVINLKKPAATRPASQQPRAKVRTTDPAAAGSDGVRPPSAATPATAGAGSKAPARPRGKSRKA